jgi:hypothetical protein
MAMYVTCETYFTDYFNLIQAYFSLVFKCICSLFVSIFLVELGVDKVALGQVFLRVPRFSPVNIIPP